MLDLSGTQCLMVALSMATDSNRIFMIFVVFETAEFLHFFQVVALIDLLILPLTQPDSGCYNSNINLSNRGQVFVVFQQHE